MKIIRYLLLQWYTDTQTGVESGPHLAHEGKTLASMKGRRTYLLSRVKFYDDQAKKYGTPIYRTYRFEIHKLEADTTLIP